MTGLAPAIPVTQNARRGIVLMVSAITLFGAMDTVVKVLAQDYPVPQVVWARFVFHALIFTVLFSGMGLRNLVTTRRPALQIARSVLLLMATLFFFTALKYLPLAEAISIGFVSPLLVTALSIPILGERVGLRRWLAILAGFAGVLLIIRPGMGVMHWAAVLPLGMACCFALYQILTRIVGRTEDPRTSQIWAPTVGIAVLSVALLAETPAAWVPPTATGWALMALTGLAGGFGHYLLIRAYALAPASLLSPFVYVQLIWMILFGYVLFGDFPDGLTIAGSLIVVGSGLYIFRREARLHGGR